jgi:Ca2+-binding EF-hand superfamily protein
MATGFNLGQEGSMCARAFANAQQEWPTFRASTANRTALSKGFAKYDEAGDGFITLGAMREVLAERGYELDELEEDAETINNRIAVVDCDASGLVDYYEYTSSGMNDSNPVLDMDRAAYADLMAAFRALDLDGDGRISKEELYIASYPKVGSDKICDFLRSTMAVVDQNQDGHIDFYEFAALCVNIK